MCWGFNTWDMDTLWRDLSYGTKTFDLMTLIMNFDLVVKNFNLSYIFWTKCTRALILDIEMHYEETFLLVPRRLTLWPWSWTCDFDLEFWPRFEKNFNLGYIFWTKCVGALILEIKMHYEESFSMVPRPLTLWRIS
jgi:hypothetical protein